MNTTVMRAPLPRPSTSLSRPNLRLSRALSWVGLAVLWGVSAALLVFGARAVVALGV